MTPSSSVDNISIDSTFNSINETGSIISSFPVTNNGLFRLTYGSMKDSWAIRDGKDTNAVFCRTRKHGRQISRRLVHKNGECNVSHVNVPKQRRKYIRDIFTTLIDVKWRWSLLIFAAGFMLSWLVFACLYYLICLNHGDFDHYLEKDWKPCIYNIPNNSFSAMFLFSLESQHTIGYGYRYISDQCGEAIFVLCLQSVVGVMIQSFLAGVVFSKLARPKRRAETLIFSKNAVIFMRDGNLCFLFRVGDMRTSLLVEAHVRLQMVKKKVTQEAEMLAFHQFDMDVGYDEGLDRIFLVWPVTICHIIDERSPLYEFSAESLPNGRFEIIAILEGIVESTGMTTQARTSWLPSEILWGHRFEKLVTYQQDNGDYKIDYERFHNSYAVDTPSCSAKELDDMKSESSTPQSGNREDDSLEVETIAESIQEPVSVCSPGGNQTKKPGGNPALLNTYTGNKVPRISLSSNYISNIYGNPGPCELKPQPQTVAGTPCVNPPEAEPDGLLTVGPHDAVIYRPLSHSTLSSASNPFPQGTDREGDHHRTASSRARNSYKKMPPVSAALKRDSICNSAICPTGKTSNGSLGSRRNSPQLVSIVATDDELDTSVRSGGSSYGSVIRRTPIIAAVSTVDETAESV